MVGPCSAPRVFHTEARSYTEATEDVRRRRCRRSWLRGLRVASWLRVRRRACCLVSKLLGVRHVSVTGVGSPSYHVSIPCVPHDAGIAGTGCNHARERGGARCVASSRLAPCSDGMGCWRFELPRVRCSLRSGPFRPFARAFTYGAAPQGHATPVALHAVRRGIVGVRSPRAQGGAPRARGGVPRPVVAPCAVGWRLGLTPRSLGIVFTR